MIVNLHFHGHRPIYFPVRPGLLGCHKACPWWVDRHPVTWAPLLFSFSHQQSLKKTILFMATYCQVGSASQKSLLNRHYINMITITATMFTGTVRMQILLGIKKLVVMSSLLKTNITVSLHMFKNVFSSTSENIRSSLYRNLISSVWDWGEFCDLH